MRQPPRTTRDLVAERLRLLAPVLVEQEVESIVSDLLLVVMDVLEGVDYSPTGWQAEEQNKALTELRRRQRRAILNGTT